MIVQKKTRSIQSSRWWKAHEQPPPHPPPPAHPTGLTPAPPCTTANSPARTLEEVVNGGAAPEVRNVLCARRREGRPRGPAGKVPIGNVPMSKREWEHDG